MSSLLNIQCNDIYGNPITDPDRSNPTRWRMERPLDTIRAFEHAIDKEHSSRASVYAPPPGNQNGYQSQRSSMYWNQNNNQSNSGYDQNGRFSNFSANGENYQQQMRSNPRLQSDPMLNRYNSAQNVAYQGQNGEMVNGQQYSYAPQDAGYGQQDENAYAQGAQHPPRFASQQAPAVSSPQLGSYGYGNAQQQQGGYYQSSPNLAQQQMPRPLPKDVKPLPPAKGPIRLDNPNPPQQKEERTSWLKKRFSRSK